MAFEAISGVPNLRDPSATYGMVDDLMIACLIIYIDGDATKGGHFGSEIVKKRVVLS
jgi:hypothetical protein